MAAKTSSKHRGKVKRSTRRKAMKYESVYPHHVRENKERRVARCNKGWTLETLNAHREKIEAERGASR